MTSCSSLSSFRKSRRVWRASTSRSVVTWCGGMHGNMSNAGQDKNWQFDSQNEQIKPRNVVLYRNCRDQLYMTTCIHTFLCAYFRESMSRDKEALDKNHNLSSLFFWESRFFWDFQNIMRDTTECIMDVTLGYQQAHYKHTHYVWLTSSSNNTLEGRRKARRSCTLRFLPSESWFTRQFCGHEKKAY